MTQPFRANDLLPLIKELVWELKGAERNCEAVEAKLKSVSADVAALEQTLRTQSSGESAVEPCNPDVSRKIASLQKRAESFQAEIKYLATEKLMLMQTAERRIHGGPVPTAADWAVLDGKRPHACDNLIKVLKAMPEQSVVVLARSRFFEFALSFLEHSAQQVKRGGVASVEHAAITATHTIGHRAKFISTVTQVSDEDMVKL
jgi:hypothetical protein